MTALGKKKATVAVLGDSNTKRFGLDTPDSGWFEVLIGELQGICGFGGAGFLAAATMGGSEDATSYTNQFSVAVPANSVDWTPNAAAGTGYNGRWIEAWGASVARLKAAEAVTMSVTTSRGRSRATRVGVVTLNKNGATITQPYTVSGATTASGNLTLPAVNDASLRVDWITLTPGVNTITLGQPSGGDPWICGFLFDQGDASSGVLGYNFAHHGIRLIDDGGSSAGYWRANLVTGIANHFNTLKSDRVLDCMICNAGQNDIGSNASTVENFVAAYREIATRAQAAGGCVLGLQSQRVHLANGSTLTFEQTRAAMDQVADEFPNVFAVYDEWAHLGFEEFQPANRTISAVTVAGNAAAKGWRWDDIHYSQGFHYGRANRMMQVLMAAEIANQGMASRI
ncbi:MAG: hypothetical protein JNJ45_05560 [Chthonomonas sp.]|nr:hypothetical protein [Chthonomonas sp.]